MMSAPYNKVTPLTLSKSRSSNREPINAAKISSSYTSTTTTTTSTFQGSWDPFPGYNIGNFYNTTNFPAPNGFLRSNNLPNTLGGPLAFPAPLPIPAEMGLPAIPPSPIPSLGNSRKRSRNGRINKEEVERRKRRAERFGTSGRNQRGFNSTSIGDDEENFANLNAISTKSHKFDKNKRIIGKCQNLEKPYLRLTSEPNPEFVRPLAVLKKTYDMLMKKYKHKQASYQYLCDQFKSMRQDLRVQMLENQFTVQVYQSHARIALENGDIGEFNQCQSRLITLLKLANIKPSCLEEFTSYRILYYILTEDHGAITSLRLEIMTGNNASILKHPLVRQALQLANFQLTGNYHNFMKVYSSMEGLGKKLVNLFIDKEKLKSLLTICRSYNQIPLDFLRTEFKFQNVEEAMDFLSQRSLLQFVVVKNRGEDNEYKYLDTKACRQCVLKQYSESRKIDIKGQR